MQSFQLNDQTVRFFEANETIYLITADANKAFGFDGDNTALDNVSRSIRETFTDGFILQIDNLPDRTLTVEFKELVRVIIRSSKSELSVTQDLFCQIVVNAFTQDFEIDKQQAALPPVTDEERVNLMSQAVKKRYQDIDTPQDKIDLPGWLTVTEILTNLGEDSAKNSCSLIHNLQFRFWLNRQIADIYRAQLGEEPPVVQRHKGSGYCYPPSFFGLVKLYRSNWMLEQM
jgi:hypothetical protein